MEHTGNEKLEVKFENLKEEKIPAMITISEQSRRMEDMMKMYAMAGQSMGGAFPLESTLILNSANSLVRKMGDGVGDAKIERIAEQVYALALMSQRQLTADEMQKFLYNSFDMLGEY